MTGVCAIATSLLAAAPAYAAASHTIAQVQGSGDTSPLVGQTVTVRGVVTADWSGPSNYDGYVIQSQEQDGDPSTSDAVFVYLGSGPGDTPLSAFGIGDLVEVTGSVSEFNGLTQITQRSASLVQADVGAPAATPLAETVLGSAREAYEHMLVTLPDTYALASTHNASQYGEIWLQAGDAPLVKSTETVDVTAAGPIDAANAQRLLLVDDGWNRATDASQHPGTQPWLTGADAVRNGDLVDVQDDDQFILSYGFNRWRLQPTVPISSTNTAGYDMTFSSQDSRPATPPVVGGDVQVAAFNVLNYFTTLTPQNSNARGATSVAEFRLQEQKIVKAISALDADVVALQEIENSVKLGEPRDEALATLVAALNRVDGAGTWDYVRTPASLVAANTDYITNALIFRTARVSLVGEASTILDETVWDNAREPIAQTFRAGGLEFAVVANHFKSKGGDDGVPGTDAQGEFNGDRVAQANSLLTFADGLTTDNVVLVGDFNSYTEEDPAQAIEAGGYTDLVSTRAPGQYTYTFDGELGSLDHMFVSSALQDDITGAGVWSINSPEWNGREYGGEVADDTVYRSSDHDPILLGLTDPSLVSEIDVFGINDFHGHLERVPATGDPITEPGAAIIAGALNQFRSENPNTLFVSQGDNIGASTFTSFIQNDEPTLDVLNEMGLAFSTTGNHEFDQGIDDLTGRVEQNSDFPYVAANVYRAGERVFADYYSETFGETTVAFVGAVTEGLPTLVSPTGITGVEVRDIATEVNRVAAYLTDGNEANGEADVIILSVHEGAPTATPADATADNAFGEIITNLSDEFDAVLSAHTHQEYAYEVDGLPVIQGGQYGTNLSHLTIRVDPITGTLLDITAEIVDLTGANASQYTPDPEVQAIVNAAVTETNRLGARQLGEVTGDLRRAAQTNGSENRGGESTIGNFVAEVQEWATEQQQTDFALMNPGGIRADLLFASSGTAGDADGVVTYREAATVQPFANTLVALDLTGAQLKSVLEEQWQPEGASRPFLKLGVSDELEYTYDPTAPRGERITAIYVGGELVGEDDVFRVAVNSFLASGGDNFTTLASGTNRADTGQVDLAAMVAYFEEFGEVSPPSDQRAVGVVANVPEDGSYGVGDEVQLNLSSLTFSRGEFPQATTVEVSLNGTIVGSARIDRTIVDTTDEVGRASVTFRVTAADLVGSGDALQELLITVPGTDTEIAYPLTVSVPGASGDNGNGNGNGNGDGVGVGNGVGNGNGNGAGNGGKTTAAGDRDGVLAFTGTEMAPWLIAAVLAMIAAGAALVARARRRQETEQQ